MDPICLAEAPRLDVNAAPARLRRARSLNGDGTWTAEVAIPSAGARNLYARAVQGSNKINATPVAITVTN